MRLDGSILVIQDQLLHIEKDVPSALVYIFVIQCFWEIVCIQELEAWPPESHLPVDLLPQNQEEQAPPFVVAFALSRVGALHSNSLSPENLHQWHVLLEAMIHGTRSLSHFYLLRFFCPTKAKNSKANNDVILILPHRKLFSIPSIPPGHRP